MPNNSETTTDEPNMLIRPTTASTFECITQEHHAVISGVLASAWAKTRLDPLLVQAIGLHDTPWRLSDADPLYNEERGLPHDFITFPMEKKIALYREGIDQLEEVHPWIAHLVSRHYTTFSGTRDIEELQAPEEKRRARLEEIIADARLESSDEALRWIKFFDIFSLHLCLTGPFARKEAIPRWLTNPDKWSTAPDGTELELRWADDTTLMVDPWPFSGSALSCELYIRDLSQRLDRPDTLQNTWNRLETRLRPAHLVVLE